MFAYPHLAGRLFNTPLMMLPARAVEIAEAVGPRLVIGNVNFASPINEIMQAPRGRLASSVQSVPEGARIAIVPIHGTLAHRGGMTPMSERVTSYQELGAIMTSLARDESVDGIVLDIDSGGGEAAGLFTLANTMREAGKIKPVYASLNDNAFSAAAILASTAKRVYMPESGSTGSIGVSSLHVDQSAADEKEGLKYTLITAGERKGDFSQHAPLGDEARAELQARVDEMHRIALNLVAGSRPNVDLAKVRTAGIFQGQSALDVGLVDEFGTLDDAISGMRTELEREEPMTTPQQQQQQQQPQQEAVVDLDAVRAEGRQAALTYFSEVQEICAIARRPDLAAGFIERGATLKDVRAELLNGRSSHAEAEIDPYSTGHTGGNAPTDQAAIDKSWERTILAVCGGLRS